ncbi:unnamed protein product [Rotaria magnacalcarata]|uniref:Obg-like ATPase 1 n=2 Tax=Rotaria magnacalcarata TaxID=392030 RepID=A0A819LPY5_9BILA|nr:unnamed protein product [Rotaria magnacalcarata]
MMFSSDGFLIDQSPSKGPSQTHLFTSFPNSAVDLNDDDDDLLLDNKSNTTQSYAYKPANEENLSLPLPATNKNNTNNEQLHIWQLEYYQKYFQIDTQQVLERLLGSITPKPNKSYFNSTIRHNPDLYGPFWVCATFIITVAISGNIVAYFQLPDTDFQIDFSKITLSAILICLYWWSMPTVVYFFFRYYIKRNEYTFLELLCIYGYSLTIFIPVSILWMIPIVWLQWLLTIIASVISGSVLIVTFWPSVDSDRKSFNAISMLVVLSAHLFMAICIMMIRTYVGNMPPKKKEEPKPKPLIGRLGTNLKMGIVGLPNAGKSTFFNILTKSSVPAENFPFCTINPNESRVSVPDSRFDFLCQYYEPLSKQPAYLNVVDIAGLVKGASEGQGLGNAFLSHIKACDGIFHMIRIFDEPDIAHVEGNVDPIRDMEIIHDELRLKDLELAKKVAEDLEKKVVRGNDKTLKIDYETINKVLHLLNEEKGSVRFHDWNEKEIEVLNKHLFNTSKPMVYLLNMSEEDYIKKKNKWLSKVKQWIDEHDPGATVIPFSANYEYRLIDLSAEESEKAIKESGAPSALEKIILAGYRALQLCYFFTCGKDEVKAWTVQVGTKAPHAAGRIHTDFEKGFIMAEVMKYEDFKEYGSENAVKAEGKYRQQGKNYTVEDGDIIYFKANTGGGLNAAKK